MSTIEKAMGRLKQSTEKPAAVQDEPLTNSQTLVTPIKQTSQVNENRVLNIDSKLLHQLGMVNHGDVDGNERVIKDEFRLIKHKVLKNAFKSKETSRGKNRNLVMVSSANANEGKTFVSINLALSIASERDKTVLLVDADVLSPSVGETLGFGNDMPGLTDFLQGNVDDVSTIIYPTSIEDFRVMPAGSASYMSYELLSSDKMSAFMDELANRYPDRIVVLDCPPLIGVVETVTMSNLVDQTIVVVEQNKTKVEDVKQAVSLLNNDTEIGFVINKAVHTSGHGYGYGYAYGYGYGHHSKDKKK